MKDLWGIQYSRDLPQIWWILGSAGGTGCAGNCPLGYQHCTPYHKSCRLSLQTASVLHPKRSQSVNQDTSHSQVAEVLTWCFTNTITNIKKYTPMILNIVLATFAVCIVQSAKVHKTQCQKKNKHQHTIISWLSFCLALLLRTDRSLTEVAGCCDIIEPEGVLQVTGGCRTFFTLKTKKILQEFYPLIVSPCDHSKNKVAKFVTQKVFYLHHHADILDCLMLFSALFFWTV